LALFDDTMVRSTVAIDSAVNDRARALTVAMGSHVRSLSDTLGRQANSIDESMLHGIDAVRRTSDSITRQSLQAIEGLSGQADLLKNVSGKSPDPDCHGRFALRPAGSVHGERGQLPWKKANVRMDATLQKRQGELSETLQRLSGKTSEIDEVMRGYSATLESSITQAENRARALIQQIAEGTQRTRRRRYANWNACAHKPTVTPRRYCPSSNACAAPRKTTRRAPSPTCGKR
jgi:hypothetical protein